MKKSGRRSSKSASAEAKNALSFIDNLTHTGDYNGQPFELRKWQRRIVQRIFQTRPDGLRQYRKVFLALPRKQGKTELAAAILLYLLLGTGKKGQHLYSASGDREQASLIFRAAASMVRNDPVLDRYCVVYDGYKKIACPKLDSFYSALSSEAPLKHGLSPSAVLFDELHVLPNRDLFNVLTTGFAARKEPLTLMITTAGWDRQSLCFEQWDYARKVRDGVIDDPTFLPILYESTSEDDWKSPAVWRRVMPALGDFCSIEFIRDECKRAKELPAYENTFRQLYLNQWTEQAERWLSVEKWDACAGEVTADPGSACYFGLDLSTTKDLSALAVVFPGEDGSCEVKTHFWCPADRLRAREGRDGVPYETWANQGYLTATPGDVIDYNVIESYVTSLATQYNVQAVYIDPYNATQLSLRLRDQYSLPIEFIRQGFLSLSAPTKSLERLILGGHLVHDNNPVMNWCCANAAIETDPAGNIKLSKRKSTEKIDGMAALVNAIAAWNAAEIEGDSVYESRGLITL